MASETRLKIKLITSSDSSDDPTSAETTIEADLTWDNVHAWYNIFSRVLMAAGFSEQVIMSGATRLAFNEWRSIELMRKVAEEYDLKLAEDEPIYKETQE